MNPQKFLFKFFHPVLKRISSWYLSKTRTYSYRGVKLQIPSGVFHPGLFFSTKILLEYLDQFPLREKKILELGAGSGLISIYFAKKGAMVTASDLNQKALIALKDNSAKNNATLTVIHSDLFESLDPFAFDFIAINPPFYPKDPQSEKEYAWFCGKDFQYFTRLFSQLRDVISAKPINVLMVLSEDCDIARISSIATESKLHLQHIFQKKVYGELNYIFKITAE